MLSFKNLKIRNKLQALSLISILSLIVVGYVSNYFFKTSKVLGVMINAERVHNVTFQEGVEYFYKYQITNEVSLLDSAVIRIDAANQMARIFAEIDDYLKLPEEEYIDIFYQSYQEAYSYDRENGYQMGDRIKLFLALNKDKLTDAQQITRDGYVLGEQIKKKILDIRQDSSIQKSNYLESDLIKMRGFYKDFAQILTSLIDFANTLLFWGIFSIVLILVFILWIISSSISRSIAYPVNTMVENFQIIAKGNLNTEIPIYSKNEIGQLASSFREIQDGMRTVIDYTKKVASGDYSTPITPRSDEDELSIALNVMVMKLKDSYDFTEQDSWFKSGINAINDKLRGDQVLEDISAHSLSFMMDFLHAQLGSIHLYQPESQVLKLISSSGFDPKKLKERIRLNDGIIGQAAAEKRMITLSNIPDESYLTYSSSGEYVPKQIVVLPLLFNEALVGVIELSSIQAYTENELQFIRQASEIIAINLNSAVNLLKTNELLQKTQEQASQLQVQQEELRVANEELLEHTKVLTESEKRLQVQQEELRVANEELEERTRQLEIQKDNISRKNDELTEIRDRMEIKAKELELASQYKSEFLANMSHELRTPLNSLLILSNILSNNKKGNLTEDQVQSARIIYKSGTDLLYLINEVLDLSKIEAGKMSLEIAEVNSLDIRDEILMNFKGTSEDKKLSLEVRIADTFPVSLTTDRYRLMQIIRNLLSNAFKFTSKGGVTVDFMPTPEKVQFSVSGLNPSNTCCIRVKDTGVGIPEEKLEAIFEAFQQADGSISRRYGGTGLGLSISRELIRLLGGEIKLESKVNEGSSFFIYLPTGKVSSDRSSGGESLQSVAPADEPVARQTTEKPEPVSLPAPFIEDDRDQDLHERAVLIIHPSKQQAEKYLQQARAKNYRAIVAANIQDGILLAENYHPTAIMLAAELANSKDRHYQKLKIHPVVSKLPVHLITPIDYTEPTEDSGLKTMASTGFNDALKSLESHLMAHSRRILLVEDDLVTRGLVRDLLSELNLEIEEANYAEEAYEILCREDFDCIILDLGLPDYSGEELLEKLRKNNVAIPKVIVYTGREMSKDDIRSLNTFTSTIILKGLKSDERLMDEVTLFLHQVSKTIPEAKPKTSPAGEANLFKGKKILVVDDEIRNVFALGKMLEERDIEVMEAENGQVAIDMLLENPQIDLVLMDVMMPVMDGYEAMRTIRTTPGIRDVPIICLTAKAMKEDHENALKNGANDYLSKPLSEDKLFAMLKIWLYKK